MNPDELAIQENEIVQVLRLVEDGWYEGIYQGRQGVFPSNYVEKLPAAADSAPLKSSSMSNNNNNESLLLMASVDDMAAGNDNVSLGNENDGIY